MNVRNKGIMILAAGGFLVLMAGAGLSATAEPDSHQAHHPQAAEGNGPTAGGCTARSPMMGGMMPGMMNGMMGNGMMGSGMMSSPAGDGHSQSGCGPAASATAPTHHQVPCRNAGAHVYAGATSAS